MQHVEMHSNLHFMRGQNSQECRGLLGQRVSEMARHSDFSTRPGARS